MIGLKQAAVTCAWMALAVVGMASAQAQVPEDLAAKKDFKALRSSSADPNGGNARPTAPVHRKEWSDEG